MVDGGTRNISVFDASGTFLRVFSVEGEFDFKVPGGIAASKRLNLVVISDSVGCRMMAYNFHGRLLRYWGTQGKERGQFEGPSGVAIDEEALQIIVADSGNSRIQAFDCDPLGTIVWVIDCELSPDFVGVAIGMLFWCDPAGIRVYPLRDSSDASSDVSDEKDMRPASPESKAVASPEKARNMPDRAQNTRRRQSRPAAIESKESGSTSRSKRALRPQRKRSNSNNTESRELATDLKTAVVSESDQKDIGALKDELHDLEGKESLASQELDILTKKQQELEAELSVLEELHATHESSIALSRLNLRDATNVKPALLGLNTSEEIMQCKDKLTLEEKLLELDILNKTLAKELPELQRTVERRDKMTELLEEELKRLRQELDHLPKSDRLEVSELMKELDTHRNKVFEFEQEREQLRNDNETCAQEKGKEKENIYKQLEDAADVLRKSRQAAKTEEMRKQILQSKKDELAQAVRDVETSVKDTGEISIRQVLKDSFARVDAEGNGKLDAQGIVQAFKLVGSELPSYESALKSIDIFTVEKYLKLSGQESATLDLEVFVRAFYEITS